jgi:hypothetical protein
MASVEYWHANRTGQARFLDTTAGNAGQSAVKSAGTFHAAIFLVLMAVGRVGARSETFREPFRDMHKSSQLAKVVLYQHVGFLIVILLCFLDDLLKLPALIFSEHPFAFLFRRSTLEMLLVLVVWLLVSTSTGRLIKRVRHLESFMRVCSWCRRIDYKGEWLPLERFMEQGFDTPTTHGICPECLQRQRAAIEKSGAKRKQSEQPQ